jgi:hypothetical protein
MATTCIHYLLDPFKRDAFEAYARRPPIGGVGIESSIAS